MDQFNYNSAALQNILSLEKAISTSNLHQFKKHLRRHPKRLESSYIF